VLMRDDEDPGLEAAVPRKDIHSSHWTSAMQPANTVRTHRSWRTGSWAPGQVGENAFRSAAACSFGEKQPNDVIDH
jgi:hypothetical protein